MDSPRGDDSPPPRCVASLPSRSFPRRTTRPLLADATPGEVVGAWFRKLWSTIVVDERGNGGGRERRGDAFDPSSLGTRRPSPPRGDAETDIPPRLFPPRDPTRRVDRVGSPRWRPGDCGDPDRFVSRDDCAAALRSLPEASAALAACDAAIASFNEERATRSLGSGRPSRRFEISVQVARGRVVASARGGGGGAFPRTPCWRAAGGSTARRERAPPRGASERRGRARLRRNPRPGLGADSADVRGGRRGVRGEAEKSREASPGGAGDARPRSRRHGRARRGHAQVRLGPELPEAHGHRVCVTSPGTSRRTARAHPRVGRGATARGGDEEEEGDGVLGRRRRETRARTQTGGGRAGNDRLRGRFHRRRKTRGPRGCSRGRRTTGRGSGTEARRAPSGLGRDPGDGRPPVALGALGGEGAAAARGVPGGVRGRVPRPRRWGTRGRARVRVGQLPRGDPVHTLGRHAGGVGRGKVEE